MRINLLLAFATLFLLSGFVSTAIDTGDPTAQQNLEQLSEVLESSGDHTDSQTLLLEEANIDNIIEKDDESVVLVDEFRGLQGVAEDERQAEGNEAEESDAIKKVEAAGKMYNQPYRGGVGYAGRGGKVFYANNPFSGSFQRRTNVLDDFHGRGHISGNLKYSERKSPEIVGRTQPIVDDFYGSRGSFVVRPIATSMNIPAAQPSAFPPVYWNHQLQQQNAMPLSSVQPVSIVMNTQSAVPPPSLPQSQTGQFLPTPASIESMQPVTAPVSVTQQQQVEKKLEQIEEEQLVTSTAASFVEAPSTESVQPQPQAEVQELPSSTTQQTSLFDIQLQDEEKPSNTYSQVLPVSAMESRPTAQPSNIQVQPSPLPPSQSQSQFIYSSVRLSSPVSVINQQAESLPSAPQTVIQSSKSTQLEANQQPPSSSSYSPEIVPMSVLPEESIGMESEVPKGGQTLEEGARCDERSSKIVLEGHCSATFYMCINGQIRKLECSSPLVMNPSISACDEKQRVEACQEQGQGQGVMPIGAQIQTGTQMQTRTETELEAEAETQAQQVVGEELPLERNDESREANMQMNDNGQREEQYEEQTNQILETSRTTTSMAQSSGTSTSIALGKCDYSPSSSVFALGSCTRGYGICLPSGQISQSICAAGQLFDETRNSCVDAAECASGQRKTIQHIVQLVESMQQSRPALAAASYGVSTQSLSLRTSDSRCDGAAEGAVLPIGKCLATYVLCSNQTAYTKECQSSTEVFSTALGGCILRANAPDCNSELPRVPVSIPLPVPLADDDAAADLLKEFCRFRNDGIYRHPTNCASIVQCHGGDAVVRPSCTSGLVFNEKKLACDYRANVPECDAEEEEEKSNDLPETSTCSVSSHGTLQADDSDCSVFYRCVWGRLEQIHCPRGTVFNAVLSICDYPANVPRCSNAATQDSDDDQ